jgi:hypothetical protein
MITLMTKQFPKWILAALICGIAIAQISIVYWHLLFYFWWLDIPMHILGGFWIALASLTAYFSLSPALEKDHSSVVVGSIALAATLTIGIFWEVYEFGVQHAVGDFGIGLSDTLKDLVDDLIGAVLAAWLFVHFGYNGKQ